MEQETVFIAFANQKGGVGKSAITTLFASYLHHIKRKNVAIIDCDFPQNSIYNMREDDMKSIRESVELRSALSIQFDQNKKKAYPVIKAQPEKALKSANELIETTEEKLDIILFDLPGTVNSTGILNLIFNINYIFIPIIADKRALQSSLNFFMTTMRYTDAIQGKIALKSLYMFWNKVDKRENTELYDIFNEIMIEENIPALKTSLPDQKKFNKELSLNRDVVFRSTMFPPDRKLLRFSNIDMLAQEICSIINISCDE
ncbi:ParA family protein [Dysgonomonas sp. 25]|uniref:ParA family protein n=1 Tax=Dysgonomonas sp. 25 TaxID=2302933 RepID=UPI0013D079FA|nr:ParA family protein [Dysgonomonas sp. 25]NDV69952.1 ParA family protein [Dysgonomonas sp. 25]